MNDLNIILNIIYKLIVFAMVVLWIDNPEMVGQWKAQMDIGYDSIWAEYVMDCDCTESLE